MADDARPRRPPPPGAEPFERRSPGPRDAPAGTPRREVVTGEPLRARPLPRYRAQAEIAEHTPLGDAYVRSLMRSQLRAGLTAFALLACVAGTLPLAFAALRDQTAVWFVLGFAAYPLLALLAWWYVRRAERNERDFARLVKGRPVP